MKTPAAYVLLGLIVAVPASAQSPDSNAYMGWLICRAQGNCASPYYNPSAETPTGNSTTDALGSLPRPPMPTDNFMRPITPWNSGTDEANPNEISPLPGINPYQAAPKDQR